MSAHRFFNITLALAIVVLLGVVGPALDDDPYESPAEAARAALAAGDADGHEHLLRVCRARHGELAGVSWTPQGPTCTHVGGRQELLAGAQR